MKKFITKIFIFLAITIASLILVTLINRIIIIYFNPFDIDEKRNILILGDSHTKFAFNDKILKQTYNISNNADSYFYSYVKLKEIIKDNPHIDTVLISFSTHNIQKSIENKWLLNDNHLESRLKYYFPLLDFEDIFFIINKKPVKVFIGAFSQIHLPISLTYKGIEVFGGYKNLQHNILAEELEKVKTRTEEESNSLKQANIEKKYLRNIIDYCKDNSVEPILVNTPLHKSIKQEQNKLYQFYNKYFDDVLFYDFNEIEMKDEFFGDLVHLNPQGATYFSELVKNKNLINPDSARIYKILY